MPIRVVLADDSVAMREVLAQMLDGSPDIDVVAIAEDEPTLLAAIGESRPDVVVTDVRMPGRNGIELVEELRRRGANVPVIVITGHADVPLAVQSMLAGVDDFIEKPFDDVVMLSSIRKVLARQAGDDQAQAEKRSILDRIATLSPREMEVMEGLVAGHANKAIAFDLEISARTVEVYRANVMMKMQAKTLSELVLQSYRRAGLADTVAF